MALKQDDSRWLDVVNTFLLSLVLIVVLYPLVYVVSASFSEPLAVNSGHVVLWPVNFNINGYKAVFNYDKIWVGYKNTLFYTFFGTLINLIVTLPAAYALARRDLVGRKTITWFFALTMFFSGGMIPSYILIVNLGLLNTVWAVLLPGATNMFNMIICRTFFSDPNLDSLREAAEIDGCSNTHTFIRIILPLSMPIIAVMALFFGVGHWNEYFRSMLYLAQRQELWSLQLMLRDILITATLIQRMMEQMGEEGAIMIKELGDMTELLKYSTIVVSMIPMMLLYPFIQRYFVKGVMIGAIKG